MAVDISVIIPLYNHANTIERALNSIVRQQLSVEIIVQDDMSTDNSVDIVERWAQNTQVSLRIQKNTAKLGTLHTRLAGFTQAQAEHIIFMDADDVWLGHDGMQKALTQIQQNHCDIVHFRARCIDKEGLPLEEFSMASPMALEQGEDFFTAYCKRRPYLPCVIWNKIFSRRLVEHVLPLAQNVHIFRFEDLFLTSLLMLHAQSYQSCDAYVYGYTLSQHWPMEKFAGRIKDIHTILHIMQPLMHHKNISQTAQNAFKDFLEQRSTVYAGKMCIEAEKMLFSGEKSATQVFDILSHYLDEELLFSLTLLSTKNNVHKIIDKVCRIDDF